MPGYIYLIENKITKQKYVGATTRSVDKRFLEHVNDSSRFPERPLYQAINLYGANNFSVSIIETCDVSIIHDREKYWIAHYKTYSSNGYNATNGGSGKSICDECAIILSYENVGEIKEVAKRLNYDVGTIKRVLSDNGIGVTPSAEIMKKKYGHPISAIDIHTGQTVNTFVTQVEAAQWVIEHNLTSMTNVKKVSYIIGRAARGLDNRKQAYGFIWKKTSQASMSNTLAA